MKYPAMFIGDTHFHNYKSHSTINEMGMNSRLADGLIAFEQAHSKAIEAGCKLMCITGDVFHVRGTMKPSVFNEVSREISCIVHSGIDVVIIAGNHDFENFNYGTVSIDALGYIHHGDKGVYAIMKPTVFDVQGYQILGIPYIHNVDEFKKTYEKWSNDTNPDITLIHQGVDDFRPTKDMPETGITATYLEKYNRGVIFAGHYHMPSKWGRVLNVGAPYQQNFNDEGISMGCWVGNDEGVTFHELDAPKFITIDDKFKEWDKLRHNIVRVTGKKVAKVEKLIESAKAAGAISVVSKLEKEFKSVHEAPIKISTPVQMLSVFIDSQERYKPYKEKLMSLFEKVCAGV